MKFITYIIFDDNVVTKNDTAQMTYVNQTLPSAMRNAARDAGLLAADIEFNQIPISEFQTQYGVKNLKTTPSVGVQIEGQTKITFVLGYRSYQTIYNYFYEVFISNNNPSGNTTTDNGGSENGQNGNGGNGNGGLGIPKQWWLYIGIGTGAAAILSDGAVKQTVLGGASAYSLFQYFKK